MNAATLHPLARDYLKRLKKAAANLPRARRKELIEEIESHLSEALPAGARQALAPRAGLNEWLAIPFLLIGGVIIPVLGWFIGVVLLWSSRIWTVRDKLIGTLVIPAGLATTVFLLLGVGTVSGESCSSKTVTTVGSRTVKTLSANSDCVTSGGGANYLAIALAVLLVLLPVFTSIYLGRRLTRTNTAE